MDENKKMCKICNENVTRIKSGKFDYRQSKFVDELGKLWNGKVCPKCNQERLKRHMRDVRRVLNKLC